jgi:hypothetical protein
LLLLLLLLLLATSTKSWLAMSTLTSMRPGSTPWSSQPTMATPPPRIS